MIQLLWANKIVALHSPQFGDTVQLKFGLQSKRSMDNTLYSYISPKDERTLNFSFVGLSRLEIRNYLDLMSQSGGESITLIDHNNERWFGKILSQPVASTHDGINNSTLNIIFEGVKVA